ncbi:MAG: MerR family transcriptional regulator, partial [Longicatena sp.]
KIQEVIKTTGLSKKALQYYEDKGLIEVQKDSSGYREYDELNLKRLWEIKVLRELDFSIIEIESIIHNVQREQIFQEHFNEIDKRMAQCTIQKDYIQKLYESFDHPHRQELLQEIDQSINEDFRLNEQIFTAIEKNHKGYGLTIFFILFWFSFGIYFYVSGDDWTNQVMGIFLILFAIYYAYNFFKKKLNVMPQSPLDALVDDKIYKVKKYIQKRIKK